MDNKEWNESQVFELTIFFLQYLHNLVCIEGVKGDSQISHDLLGLWPWIEVHFVEIKTHSEKGLMNDND